MENLQINSLSLYKLDKEMTAIELLKCNRELIGVILANKIPLTDIRYIDMCAEISKMRKNGEKYTYITSLMADRYGITTRAVEKAYKRMNKEIFLS